MFGLAEVAIGQDSLKWRLLIRENEMEDAKDRSRLRASAIRLKIVPPLENKGTRAGYQEAYGTRWRSRNKETEAGHGGQSAVKERERASGSGAK